MSLGLGDLKKKPRTRGSSASTKPSGANSEKAAPKVAEKMWTSQTAKPWDASGLTPAAKASKSRKKVETDDLFMNIDWATSPSIHFADFETLKEEKIAQVKEIAHKLESKIKRATSGPLKLLNSVLSLVQK